MRIRPLFVSATLVAIAGAGGFLAGRQFPGPPADTKGPGPVSKSVAAISQTRPVSNSAQQPAPGADTSRPESSPAGQPSKKLLQALEEMAGSKQPGQMEELLAAWMARDPEEVLQFLKSSPPRDEILRQVAALWAKKDPAAASSWLSGHPTVPGRDAMAAGLAAAVVKDEPDAAVQWIASIKDPLQKLAGAQASGYEFFRQSDESAMEALGKMGLPSSAIEPTMMEAWKRRLSQVSGRNAQSVASAFSAAKAAGSSLTPGNVDDVIAALNEGIKGSGQFSSTLFQVKLNNLTERERTAASGYLEVNDGNVKYTGGR